MLDFCQDLELLATCMCIADENEVSESRSCYEAMQMLTILQPYPCDTADKSSLSLPGKHFFRKIWKTGLVRVLKKVRKFVGSNVRSLASIWEKLCRIFPFFRGKAYFFIFSAITNVDYLA